MQEAIDKKIPILQRVQYIQKLPCDQHGHPGRLSLRLAAWIDFFAIIQPYVTDQNKLDHELISKICTEEGLSFVEAFEKLTFILKVVTHHDDTQNERLQKINSEHGK